MKSEETLHQLINYRSLKNDSLQGGGYFRMPTHERKSIETRLNVPGKNNSDGAH
jgi:hypothetical protein